MISKRVQGFTESVIREMTRVNNQYDGINLAQGMPNFPPPRELIEAAHRAIDGDFHQYAITWGTPSLRRAIAEKYRKFYGMDVEADRNVTVCCGSTETMLATLLAVLNPGDEVIILSPSTAGASSRGRTGLGPLEPPDSRSIRSTAERSPRAPAPSSSTARTTPPARSFRKRSCR
jgi:DNA-binding transcriptional MocR family regulator